MLLDFFGSGRLLLAGYVYAMQVPVNRNNYRVRNADFYVAFAGPLMNLVLGFGGTLILSFLVKNNLSILAGVPILELLYLFIFINFNLFLFNLIPLGPLDGNSVLPHFLPANLKRQYQHWNYLYGSQALIGLVVLSVILPHFSVFSWITAISKRIITVLL